MDLYVDAFRATKALVQQLRSLKLCEFGSTCFSKEQAECTVWVQLAPESF